MKNVKYTFYWTAHEDKGAIRNNYTDTADSVVCGPGYTFGDHLSDYHDIQQFEQEGNSYYLVDKNGERTGECYLVVSEEETDEDAE